MIETDSGVIETMVSGVAYVSKQCKESDRTRTFILDCSQLISLTNTQIYVEIEIEMVLEQYVIPVAVIL